LETGWSTSFNMTINEGKARANLRVPLEGPKGSGSLHAVAREEGGRIEYDQLDVVAGTQVIHLQAPRVHEPGDRGGSPRARPPGGTRARAAAPRPRRALRTTAAVRPPTLRALR